ncbi:hypothetical protein CS542_04770 [Pedobacter sp. IW39]|nr:hypothetical protein CS542_04770 [Pedobacter sp. IW39]
MIFPKTNNGDDNELHIYVKAFTFLTIGIIGKSFSVSKRFMVYKPGTKTITALDQSKGEYTFGQTPLCQITTGFGFPQIQFRLYTASCLPFFSSAA